jgi:hypothetical protein
VDVAVVFSHLESTLFLIGIMEGERNAAYFDVSNTTNRILNLLYEE